MTPLEKACAARKTERLQEQHDAKAATQRTKQQLLFDKAERRELKRMRAEAEHALMLAGVTEEKRKNLKYTPKLSESVRQRLRREALTQEKLRELIRYNPETGEVHRLVNQNGNAHDEPRRVQPPSTDRYARFYIEGVRGYLHRFIFFYMEGRWPAEIDHINRVKNDNRWQNLRECTHSDNCLNRSTALL